MQTIVLDTSNSILARKNAYHLSKKLFWSVLLVLASVLTVLLILTIYFGVKQRAQNPAINEVSTKSTEVTTSITLLRPIARIPDNLQQSSYHLTITPNLTNETFAGEEYFVTNSNTPLTYMCLALV